MKSALALHLLQISLIYINTLMIQRVLSERQWWVQMQTGDLWALENSSEKFKRMAKCHRLEITTKAISASKKYIGSVVGADGTEI